MRPSRFRNFIDLTNVIKLRSHDEQTQVGAVLVKRDTRAIIATGYNGFVRDAPDKDLPKTRPEKYEFMVHAEENVITHCARHGISTDNCMMFLNINPCTRCSRLLWQCGITCVVIEDIYEKYFEAVKNMPDLKVEVLKTPEGYYMLNYRKVS